jgi:predicted nucleotidyltransferase
MRVAADGLICGVSAVTLRGLLRREQFSTVDAMKAFLLAEPQVTDLMAAFENDGWIAYTGRSNGEDWWIVAAQGHRLTATKIVKRIPEALGWQLVTRLVDQARIVNAEPSRSQRISAIYLFGSLLTGSEDGTVGDVDVVVNTTRRAVPKEQFEKLRLAEIGDRRVGVGGWSFGPNAVKKALLKVSRSISIHDEADLQLPGVRYRQIYAFDAKQEREVPFDPEEQVHPEPFTEEDLVPTARRERFPGREFRPWPKAPSRTAKCQMDQEHCKRSG